MGITAHNDYVGPDNVRQAVVERALVLTCVDNHPARVCIDRHAVRLRDVCVISAGNERLDGNVHVSLRRAGRPLTAPLLDRHPEIAAVTHGDRTEAGCGELIARGEPQLLVTNFMAAAAMLTAFHALWTPAERKRRAVVPQELYFDVGQGALSLIPAAV